MSLTKETTVKLQIGTIVVLAGALLYWAVLCVTEWNTYLRNKDRLDNVRNRTWVLEHPDHPWSKRYRENHPELE